MSQKRSQSLEMIEPDRQAQRKLKRGQKKAGIHPSATPGSSKEHSGRPPARQILAGETRRSRATALDQGHEEAGTRRRPRALPREPAPAIAAETASRRNRRMKACRPPAYPGTPGG